MPNIGYFLGQPTRPFFTATILLSLAACCFGPEPSGHPTGRFGFGGTLLVSIDSGIAVLRKPFGRPRPRFRGAKSSPTVLSSSCGNVDTTDLEGDVRGSSR
jgi:hypothetical protein